MTYMQESLADKLAGLTNLTFNNSTACIICGLACKSVAGLKYLFGPHTLKLTGESIHLIYYFKA